MCTNDMPRGGLECMWMGLGGGMVSMYVHYAVSEQYFCFIAIIYV